jgi:DMSO/TMAO reductase YedYZ molybdopterin-dependent catalytic subunit
LSFAEVKSSAVEVMPIGVDNPYGGRPLPISKAMEDDSLLSYLMKDEILTVDHGLPVLVFLSGWVRRISWKSDNTVISLL